LTPPRAGARLPASTLDRHEWEESLPHLRPIVVALAAAAALALPSCRSESPEPATGTPLHFFREHVTVEPSDGRVRVVGIYHFRNESDRPLETGIRYPFPVDRNHMNPFRVRVWEFVNDEPRPVGFVHGDMSVAWRMEFSPREERSVRVEYVQEIKRNRATYIVTTTQAWRRPIDLAEFEFRVPAHLEDVELSFEPDRADVEGDTIVYYMRAESFLPDADLTVTWR
jgi:hypothetical protein